MKRSEINKALNALLDNYCSLCRENAVPPSNPMGIRIDSKRRKKTMREAQGYPQIL